jgi:hypothetical protein
VTYVGDVVMSQVYVHSTISKSSRRPGVATTQYRFEIIVNVRPEIFARVCLWICATDCAYNQPSVSVRSVKHALGAWLVAGRTSEVHVRTAMLRKTLPVPVRV